MNTLAAPSCKPWYREPWPWFLISLPATAVVAGVATVWIAATNSDGLVVGDYYKAGLAINQTLARDETARTMALRAALDARDGTLSVTLAGALTAWPQRLTLTLAHPTRSGQDRTVELSHAGDGRYRAALPDIAAGKWHAQMTDASAGWRLAGALTVPLDETAVLSASEAPFQPLQGD